MLTEYNNRELNLDYKGRKQFDEYYGVNVEWLKKLNGIENLMMN